VKPFRISHLSVGFVALVGAMSVALALYMNHELEGISETISARERLAAGKEVREALQAMQAEAQHIAGSLAEWDETRQQLAFSEYYALWRDTRVKDSGMVPETVDRVSLYDKQGTILAPNPDNDPIPARLNLDRLPGYLLMSSDPPEHGHPHVAYFRPVYADPSGQVLLGFVGVKFDLMGELTRTRQFRYADITRIQAPKEGNHLTDLMHLVESIQYEVPKNPSLQLIHEVFKKELIHLLLFVIIILSIASFLLHRVMIRPLLAISREIDSLQGASSNLGSGLMAARNMPVLELENVRRSFNNYQSRLAELHSNLEQSSQDFYLQAHHDALSGAHNRRAFEEDWRDSEALERCDRCALVLFDCDHFKAINDTYGHAAGDEVIKALAICLEKSLRSGDRLYRLGGDEFATVLPDADREIAQAIAERCLEKVVAHDFKQYGLSEPVSISIGVAFAECGTHQMALGELQKRADLAMYAAKRPGSAKIVFYHDELGEVAALVANRSVSGVYQAIQDSTLIEMHYQAIMRLPETEKEYVEALARIRFEGHLLSPADIFSIVQARRLDAEFDLAIIETVQRDMQHGRLPVGQGVSINVSAPGIVHAKVVDALLALREAEPGRKIVIEITETALITQMEVASAHIRQLRTAGCLIALDDFGSGYSSLRYLSSMPVDLVKFDISMTRLLEHSDPQQALITAEVAAMVKNAGYRIVAEGVETQAMLDRIKQIGFHYAQGYFFGKPS
jgi:diguanylate cyclase (GGDEF)-like protein